MFPSQWARRHVRAWTACGLLWVVACGTDPVPPPNVTLVLVNGRIWTNDAASPWTEALAIADGRIVATGGSDAVSALAGDAETINLRRGLVLPGFIDTRTDLLWPDLPGEVIDLSTARSRRQLVSRVAAAANAHAPGAWLVGRDWDQRLWGDIPPHRDWIDQETADHPAWLAQRDGELGLANSLALDRAGITVETPGARLGPVGRELSGLLEGAALRQLEASLPTPSDAARNRNLDAALARAAEQGVTSVHHLGRWDDLDVLGRAHDEGGLTTRVYAAVPLADWLQLDRAIALGRFGGSGARGDDRLRVGAVHADLDGSLAAQSAAFHTPYRNVQGHNGALRESTSGSLADQLAGADQAGLQILLLATGDRAVSTALDLHAALPERLRRTRRFRVDGAHHILPDDLVRFALDGVLVGARPFAALHEGRWVDRELGPERARSSFPFQALRNAGARVSFGSGRLDNASPLDGIYAAVTRRTLDGLHPLGWVPEERLSVEDAIDAYTGAAAYAGFSDEVAGRLTVGRYADLILVDRDLLSVDAIDIPLVKVIMTIVGGEIVFDARPSYLLGDIN